VLLALCSRETFAWHSKGRTYTEALGCKVFWRIFGPNKEQVTGGWRKLGSD
jgi:hypothetical protein